jgi:periplasmic divalent cation tolerance protein
VTPCIVLTTLGADFDAQSLAAMLVERRLAACVNIFPVRSVYRWKEGVELGGEQLLLIKTVNERIAELREALFAQHPYEVPEFIVLPIDRIGGPYREWLVDSVTAST